MANIHKAYASDFEAIYPLFQEFNNPLLKHDDWQQLFVRRWGSQEDHFGYYLEEDGAAVGFLGTIFSQRKISGQMYKFCNLSTWIVKKEYRGASLMLLFEVLKLKDYTITNFTANRVAKIMHTMGFKDLAERLYFFLPLSIPGVGFSNFTLHTEKHAIEQRLQSDALAVFRDHADLKCHHLLVEHDGEQCYLVFDIIKKKRLPVARVHHISSLPFFVKFSHRFTFKVCLKTRTAGLLVAENLLHNETVRSKWVIPQKQALVYRSDCLTSQDIDTLYSELQVLGLRT
jgi:hypothetical protein